LAINYDNAWADSEGTECDLTELDLTKRSCRLLVKNVVFLKVDPIRHVWMGMEDDPHPTVPLGENRCVWAHWLFAGNWLTGSRRQIVDGIVDVYNYRFRP